VQANEVIVPTSLNDALAALKRNPNAVISAGGTTLFSDESVLSSGEPKTILSLHAIPELKAISRTDRYVEVGSMTPLSELLGLKEGFIPEAMREVLRNIGTFAVRNLATLGGNLSSGTRFRDCFPVLACMDALAEYRHLSAARWVNLNRLINDQGYPLIPQNEILTRIRIPLAEWKINVVQKFGVPLTNSLNGAIFVFLARLDKRALSDFRIFYSYERALRSREAESAIIGKKIPLSERDIELTLNAYKSVCQQREVSQPQTARFLALVRRAFALLDEGATF